MRKIVSIPSELVDYANTKDIDEMLKTLWDAVRYRLTWEIVDGKLLVYLDANLKRSQSMQWKKNRLWHTKNKCVTDLKISVQHTKNKCVTHLKKDRNTLKSNSSELAKPTNEDEALGIYINSNMLLYDIVYRYIHNNIQYWNIQYLINTQWEKKYLVSQMKEAEKIIKKIWMDNFKTILNFIYQDDFRSKQILSIAKLNRKNKDGVPYYIVMMDKIKQYTPKVISIPTV